MITYEQVWPLSLKYRALKNKVLFISKSLIVQSTVL